MEELEIVPQHQIDGIRIFINRVEYRSPHLHSEWELLWVLDHPLNITCAQKKYEIRFNVDGLLRGDYKSRMEGYAVGINNGFLCPNDVRRLEGFDLIPDEKGGNNFLLQGAMIKLEDAGIYAGKQ